MTLTKEGQENDCNFGPDWVPSVIDKDIPLPTVENGGMKRRKDVLSLMRPGQSFGLPGHLVDLWRRAAQELRKNDPDCSDWKFASRKIDELTSRFWRVS